MDTAYRCTASQRETVPCSEKVLGTLLAQSKLALDGQSCQPQPRQVADLSDAAVTRGGLVVAIDDTSACEDLSCLSFLATATIRRSPVIGEGKNLLERMK